MTTPPSGSAGPIVVGLDGSPSSLNALRWAAAMGQRLGAPVHVVTAWQFPVMYGDVVPPASWDPENDMRRVQSEAMLAVLGAEEVDGFTRALQPGGAAQVLLDASAAAQMLIVGSRGHGGFAGLLLGSVSAAVAEHATCPVLIVHGDQPPPGTTEG